MPKLEGYELKSMKLSRSEAKEASEPEEVEGPEYPHGLSLRLDDESLGKLGMKSLPEVGKTLLLAARVEVTEVSEHSRRGQEEPVRGLSLQITEMDLAENPGKKSTAEKIYG